MIALFGGSFDPVHNGHLAVANAVQKAYCPERLWFLPCGQPVHKAALQASSKHRLAMLRLALGNTPFGIDDQEIRAARPSYSIDSVRAYRQRLAAQQLCFVIGADSFAQLHLWKDVDRLLDNCCLLVVNRDNDWPQASSAIAARVRSDTSLEVGTITQLLIRPEPVSSTEIREQFATANVPQGLPQAVADYIEEHRLYRYSVTKE